MTLIPLINTYKKKKLSKTTNSSPRIKRNNHLLAESCDPTIYIT